MCRLTPDASLLCASPFHHLAGLANFAVALDVGAASVPITRFSVAAFREACAHAPTHALLVPTMIEMLLEAGGLPVPSIRYLQYGASPIRPATMRRLAQLMPDVEIANLFGQTEGAPLTCLTPADHRRAVDGDDRLLESVGRPVPGAELRIADPDGDGIGEVLARGPHLPVTDDDGWLHTGDLGRTDEAGYLYLVARQHDRIVRGGENVYPAEVERVLDAQPGVKESAVVGVPDDRLGERVVAFVVPDSCAAPPEPDDLRQAASAVLAGFKVPSHVHIVDELPRNAAGKVLRRHLVPRDEREGG
jgi:acyl-CoA synthetase (AMP-forming)/AMP-acid ligase II